MLFKHANKHFEESKMTLIHCREVKWDRDDVWFAHCCMLDDKETKLFASNSIGLAHCPSSNMRLASGIAPIRQYLDAGVNCGMGVDGTASNDTGHMLAEVRLAMFLQRSKGDINGESHCRSQALVMGVMSALSSSDTMQRFEELGLFYHCDKMLVTLCSYVCKASAGAGHTRRSKELGTWWHWQDCSRLRSRLCGLENWWTRYVQCCAPSLPFSIAPIHQGCIWTCKYKVQVWGVQGLILTKVVVMLNGVVHVCAEQLLLKYCVTSALTTCHAGFAGGRKDPVGNLVLCASSLGFVDLSVINGEVIVKDGELLSLDLKVLFLFYKVQAQCIRGFGFLSLTRYVFSDNQLCTLGVLAQCSYSPAQIYLWNKLYDTVLTMYNVYTNCWLIENWEKWLVSTYIALKLQPFVPYAPQFADLLKNVAFCNEIVACPLDHQKLHLLTVLESAQVYLLVKLADTSENSLHKLYSSWDHLIAGSCSRTQSEVQASVWPSSRPLALGTSKLMRSETANEWVFSGALVFSLFWGFVPVAKFDRQDQAPPCVEWRSLFGNKDTLTSSKIEWSLCLGFVTHRCVRLELTADSLYNRFYPDDVVPCGQLGCL